MRKFTLLLMSMFFVLGTAMAKDEKEEEKKGFEVTFSSPSSTDFKNSVSYIQIYFSKDVTVAFPEGGINVINTETKETAVVISNISDNPNLDKNCVVFEFKEKVEGKDGVEYKDQVITTPGTYSYTIPAGVIKSVDGDEFPETTFTFSVVKTFDINIDGPIETIASDKIVLAFDKEITSVVIPGSGMSVLDGKWMPVCSISKAVIGEDKKTVTFELSDSLTTPGTYNLDLYPGVIVSVDGINNYKSLSINVIDLAPSFTTTYNDGDKVKELGNVFEIAFKNVKEVKLLQETMTVYLPSQGDVEGKATLADNKITVTFEQKFTAEGEYSFYIPEGMFTMDGVANEGLEVKVTLFTFKIEPLEIVSVTPAVGKVDQIEEVVITFNQVVTPSYDADWQMISREISLTCGEQTYTLTYAPKGYAATNQLRYITNAVWKDTDYESTPITADGAYVLNLADIVVDHAGEDGLDAWGYPTTVWHSKNVACQGAYTWTIGEGDSAVDFVSAEAGEQVIYDLLGRRVEKIVEAGLYIVNGKKVVIK